MKTNNNSSSSVINELQYSLHNSENFNDLLKYSAREITEKYILVIKEYLKFAIENISLKKNIVYSKYIIIKGLEAVTHVFFFILYYTKNLSLSYYHSQKSYYLFIEFVGQISEEQNSFLQLSTKDATMYVYKKSIFELHNDLKKNITQKKQESEVLDKFNKNILLFKIIVNFFIHKIQFQRENSDISGLYIPTLETVLNKFNALDLSSDKSNVMYFLLENISNVASIDVDSNKYLKILDSFLNIILKNPNLFKEERIKKKILALKNGDLNDNNDINNDSSIINNLLNNMMNGDIKKFINYLFES